MTDPREFQVGAAWRDISPPQPTLLKPTGMGRLAPTGGVLDALRVEALAIRAGGELAFVTTSDLRVVWWHWAREIGEAVAARTGCDPKKVLCSAVHNHCSSPEAGDKSPEAQAALEEANRKILDGFIEACVEAAGRLAPAEIAAATAELHEPIGQCRRSRLSNGTVANCWGSGPVIPPGQKYASPAGPDAMQIDILAARHVGEKAPFAVLTTYGSHPHLYGLPAFSGEFPGALKRRIEQLLPGALSHHTNTTGGNIDLHCVHPIPPGPSATNPGGDPDQVKWFQQSAALLAERFARAVLPAIPAEARAWSRPAVLRHIRYESEPLEGPGTRPMMCISAIGLGDTAIVSIPSELFLEFGLRIRAESPFAHTILMGYNGSGAGYIPPAIAFEQGGYETMRGPRSAPRPERPDREVLVEPDTGEKITAQVLKVLGELHAPYMNVRE